MIFLWAQLFKSFVCVFSDQKILKVSVQAISLVISVTSAVLEKGVLLCRNIEDFSLEM